MEKADPRRTFICALANALRRNLAYASSMRKAPPPPRETMISLKQRSPFCSTQDLLTNYRFDYISPLTHHCHPLSLPLRQGDYQLVSGVPLPREFAPHAQRNFRRHRHVVEALRDGRARAPVYALGHSLPRMHVHPKREAAPRLDGKLRLSKPLPRLWLGTRADGFQTTPLRRIVQIYVAQKASSV